MSKYKIKEPMPQYGANTARIINVPDEVVKQIRAEAIDEFANWLKAECRKCYVDCDPYGSGIEEDSILYEDDIDEIAEELKEQNK